MLGGGKGTMEDVQNLFKMSLEAIDRMLTARQVVGEPMTVEGNTLVPLVSVGFGFGAGGGTGTGTGRKGQSLGSGANTGAGGGVRTVGVVVVSKDGVRVETLHGGVAGVVEKVAGIAAKAMETRGKKEE